jgi:hypothetical protein
VNDSFAQLPDNEALAAGLTSELGAPGRVNVVHRQPNPLASTFPSEVVSCAREDGAGLRLLCKYGGQDHPGHGHRGGLAYEVDVYRRVLAAASLPLARFHGAAPAGPTGVAWLAIGYIEPARRLNYERDLGSWELAATWIGCFHAELGGRLADAALDFLNAYDAAYYAGWARRAAEYASDRQREYPWLRDLCLRAQQVLPELLDGPRTVIHGEYCPKNILIKDGSAYPVDWESAALACGAIDMATLTDRGDPELVRRCETAYRLARWPAGSPPGFTRRLELARLYVHLRWLGATPGPKLLARAWRYEEVRAVGDRLGLI